MQFWRAGGHLGASMGDAHRRHCASPGFYHAPSYLNTTYCPGISKADAVLPYLVGRVVVVVR
ncbi:hypothetical protein E2C01_006198 [Portunus trituberculatus]|uniref:Uncharacterized protein n=1 Tax=Portunus trituberculatus TaxID=210409 RepID=A0A5B7D150_PORTR|nr:hypothetical protein [Portunus trituberculatus]